jgi:hypothetical protein
MHSTLFQNALPQKARRAKQNKKKFPFLVFEIG